MLDVPLYKYNERSHFTDKTGLLAKGKAVATFMVNNAKLTTKLNLKSVCCYGVKTKYEIRRLR